MNPYPKTPEERFKAEYELALREGNQRFGCECRHEHTRKGICVKCLRRVVTR